MDTTEQLEKTEDLLNDWKRKEQRTLGNPKIQTDKLVTTNHIYIVVGESSHNRC